MSKFLSQLLKPALCTSLLFMLATASAQEVVSESDITRQPEGTPPANNWVGYTRAGTPPTALKFVEGPGNPPMGCGSLLLSTITAAEKVFLLNYDHEGTLLSEIDEISYATYQISSDPSQPNTVASIIINIDYNGPNVAGGEATLVYEPVYSVEQQGDVVPNTWQTWMATGDGVWWSTRPINDQCAGAFIHCWRTWDEIVASNPDAVVLSMGLNQGEGNPNLVSAVDAFTFDDVTYNFEPSADSDGDGEGDSCDKDDDNDGVPDNQDCAPQDAKNDKVIVCHNGKEICVSRNAVDAHRKHGDQVGPCAPRADLTLKNSRRIESFEGVPVNRLYENAPNPFRGTTTIKYELSADSRVAIRVYDMMGREVATVVNANKKAGLHTVEYRSENVPKGVYFYRITAASDGKVFEQSRSMIVQ